jgi:hypothetical protein
MKEGAAWMESIAARVFSYLPDQRSIDAITDANTVAAAVALQLWTLNNMPQREKTLLVAMPT